MNNTAERSTRSSGVNPHREAQGHAATPGFAANPRDTAQRQRIEAAFGAAAQRMEEEEPLQGRFLAQRMEEEEPLQGRFETAQRAEEEELLQGRFVAQRVEEEEPLQGKAEGGLPVSLKAGVEALSGVSMDGVQVHYNSGKPAQLNALAYAQGRDIHVAPGQEQHLPHEAWHVAQQAQGRVQPTTQMQGGVAVNDDRSLETEADVMGAKALAQAVQQPVQQQKSDTAQLAMAVAQMRFEAGSGSVWHVHKDHVKCGNNLKSRVNFTSRTSAQILASLQDAIDRHGLNIGGTLAASYAECVAYINTLP